MPKGIPNPKPAERDVADAMLGQAEEDVFLAAAEARAAQRAFVSEATGYVANSGDVEIYPAATIKAIDDNKDIHSPTEFGRLVAGIEKRDPLMVVMKLLRNYVPMGEFEIVGYTKPAVTKKNAAGTVVVISPEEFIKGEAAPPVLAGTGFANKLWAGTTVKLPSDEAKGLYNNKIASRDFED